MNVNIIPTPNFKREAKKLLKKYRSLKGELAELTTELISDPRKGTRIKENVYKIRVAVTRSVVLPARASRMPSQGVTSRKHPSTGVKWWCRADSY